MKERYPLAIACSVFLALVAFVTMRSLALTHGHLAYALDDAYIHLAVAKNIVRHHVWGISPNTWSGVSSSLLWTVLVSALFVITGVQEYIPFALNVLFGIELLYMLDVIWRRLSLPSIERFALLLLTFLALPLASQPLIGMEVTLQCLLVAAFYYYLSFSNTTWKILAAAFLLGAVRYETVAIVELVALGLLFTGEAKKGWLVAISGLLPACVYGVIAVGMGGTFVPNTLLIKAHGMRVISERVGEHLTIAVAVALLAILLLVVLTRFVRKRFTALRIPIGLIVIATTVVTALLQSLVSDAPQQFERYRTYLFLSLLLCIGYVLSELHRRIHSNAVARRRAKITGVAVYVVLLLALIPKFLFYLRMTPIATKNIYDECVQEGRFVRDFCEGKTVATFDIGAISFYGESPIVDLNGLGSDDVARVRLNPIHLRDSLNVIVMRHDTRVAILYPADNYSPRPDWRVTGKFIIDSNYVCANDTVNLFTVHDEDTAWLRDAVQHFKNRTTTTVLY